LLKERLTSYGLYHFTIVGVGICSITSQVVLFRELFSILEGNEVIISLSMFLWLLFGSFGSLIAKIVPVNHMLYLFLCLSSALLPPYLIFFIRYLYGKFFIYGEALTFKASAIFACGTLGLYALIIGILLPYSQKVISERVAKTEAADVYILDNLGDNIGAALSTVLLLLGFKFQNLILISAIPIILAVIALTSIRNKLLTIPLILTSGLTFIACFSPSLDLKTLSFAYKDLVRYKDSVYGRIVVTKTAQEITVWESGLPYILPRDITTAEEKAHYPLAQRENIGNVLLISGYSPELVDEILKHNLKEIDYVELDPQILTTAREFNLIHHLTKLNLIPMDAKKYVSQCKKPYDAVIMDLPTPDTFQLARFYTTEYFSEINRILTPRGVFSFSIEYSQNYLSRYQKELLNVLIATVKDVFPHYMIIPGERLYILGSKAPLSLNIPLLLNHKGITSSYISGYFDGNVTKERIQSILSAIKDTSPNTELNSNAFRLVIEEWFSKASVNPHLVYLMLILAFVLCLAFFSITKEQVIFSSGFLLMGAEIILIYLFQICHGYAYLVLSAVIFSFLFGLLPGSYLARGVKRYQDRWAFFCDILLTLMILVLLLAIYRGHYRWSPQVYLGYGFLLSFIVGMQFPLLARLKEQTQEVPYKLFSADLAGAGLGVIMVGGFLAPFFGIFWAVFSLLCLKALCIILGLWRQ